MEGGAEEGAARGVISNFLKSSLVSLDLKRDTWSCLHKNKQTNKQTHTQGKNKHPDTVCEDRYSLSCSSVVVHLVAIRSQRVGVTFS